MYLTSRVTMTYKLPRGHYERSLRANYEMNLLNSVQVKQNLYIYNMIHKITRYILYNFSTFPMMENSSLQLKIHIDSSQCLPIFQEWRKEL